MTTGGVYSVTSWLRGAPPTTEAEIKTEKGPAEKISRSFLASTRVAERVVPGFLSVVNRIDLPRVGAALLQLSSFLTDRASTWGQLPQSRRYWDAPASRRRQRSRSGRDSQEQQAEVGRAGGAGELRCRRLRAWGWWRLTRQPSTRLGIMWTPWARRDSITRGWRTWCTVRGREQGVKGERHPLRHGARFRVLVGVARSVHKVCRLLYDHRWFFETFSCVLHVLLHATGRLCHAGTCARAMEAWSTATRCRLGCIWGFCLDEIRLLIDSVSTWFGSPFLLQPWLSGSPTAQSSPGPHSELDALANFGSN